MKKILIVSLALIFAFTGVLYAVGVNGEYKGKPIVNVTLNGVELTPEDVPGILLDGRTMIPLSLLRQIGFTVEWDNETKTANVIPPIVEAPPSEEPSDTPTDKQNDGTQPEKPNDKPSDKPSDNGNTEQPKQSDPPKSDNSATCQSIRDSYHIQLLQLGELNTAGKRNQALIIDYQRDQALSSAGCN